MYRIINILLFLLLSITAFAQRAPITVSTILTPPYTTSLSTMAESGSTRLMVNLLVNDVTITEIPFKLHIKMESSGITIESIPTQAVAPMFLGGGEARVLTGDDFAQYFNLNNLNFKGFSKEAYIKNGQLPAGLWKFSVSVRHFYTNKTISNIGTVTAWITSYKPPVLASPKDGENAPSNAALPLTFSWQASKHTGGTAAIMYRFEMWERRIEGVPAQTVAASVPPIYTTETAGRYVEIIPATLALEPGMKYCWRVTAYDPSGMVTIENKGESEVRTFQYLEKCPEVCGLIVDVKDDTGYASWEENRQHLGGYNFEFYDDEGTCYKTLWGGSTKTAGIGGEYGKTWHVRVQGICRSSVEGPWSDWVDFKIPDAFKPLKDENGNTYGCGREVPERVITNFELIDNIQKGDTLEDERGTTKYIVHSAIKNEDGSFRGLSYMKLSFWGVKVLGEYNNMKVNTDGVIIGRYAWQSVKSDLLVADPEDIEKWADELALEMAGATYNNTIKDTIVLKYSRGIVPFETIAREGTKYYAVTSDGHKEEITSFINGQKRVMVKDGDGHELVINKDGNVMGVEEYKKCGGSKALLRENIKEKDSQLTKSDNVKFFGTGDYLFDTYDNYSGKTGYAERFPSIGEGDYRPAYACVESKTKLEIKAEPYKTYTFKNERGVPVLCKDGILEVTARGDRDTTSIYAYDAENHIVGKVNVLSYDKQTRKICLVPIGDTKAPDASTVKQGLDEIFAKLMVDFDVTIGEPIAIQYAKDNIFTHGGSGVIGVYNTDQKAAISKLKERGIDNETVYLFFVNDCKALKANDSPDVVNGYMPRGYQFGFIYNELNNYRTIAHEICHGAFHLKHTFDATDYLAAERTTDNLMDYNDGETLNHWQWKDIHQPKSVRFKWLQEEEGAEAWSEGTRYKCISIEIAQKIKAKYRYFYYPDGAIVDMKDNLPSGFYLSNDVDAKTSYGAVATIRNDNKDLYYVFDRDTHQNKGYGYRLGDKAVLLYDISPISNPKLDELNPVRVFIEGNNIRTVDSHGEEVTYDNSVCDCNMAKYRELTPDMLISEVNEPLSKAPRMFYDPKTNEIIFVTEVHDLKWFRVAEDGPQYDLDSLVAQGATYHYYTEAELANTNYNQLRADVQNAMKEGGKVVMIGLAATIAAPYLIEYAAVYGMEAGSAILQNTFKKFGKDFLLGSTSEALSYLLAEYIDKKVLSEPAQNIELGADFVSDIISAGFRNMVKPSEKIKSISVCIDGVNIDDLLNSDEDAIIRIIRGSIQCAISTGSDKLFDVIKSRISHKLINVTSQRIVMAIRKLNHNNPEAELEMVSFLCRKNNHWLSEMKRIIREYGNGAFYMLQDLDIDYMKLSTSNFERLSRFVKTNVGNENELNIMKSLLNSGRDINRMLRYIYSEGSSAKILDEICNNELFLSKIEIGGKKISARQFLLDYNGDIAMYYKRDGNYEKYIVYAIDDMKQYVELSIDNTSNTLTKIFVGYITREFDNLVSGYKNIE